MSRNTFRRKELKYVLTAEQYTHFMKSISSYIKPDEHPRYSICNVYMDTPDYRLIRRSIEKPVYKEKMRIRSYGVVYDDRNVFVELKKKYKGTVYKRRIKMANDCVSAFIEGRTESQHQIEHEIEYFLKFYSGIRPAMYISYEREAFHALDDYDLRITFDNNILWRDEDVALTSEIYGQRILEKGRVLLEIKCTDTMPLWLVKALTMNRIYKTSFSKYGTAYHQKLADTA